MVKIRSIAPDNAVTSIIAIRAAPFNANITSKETVDIAEIPADNPSKPSIRLIQLIIDTINIIVIG